MAEYLIPSSLEAALEALATGEYIPYAGGTDLNNAPKTDKKLLFIGKLPELKTIAADGEFIRLGACVTFAEARRSETVPWIMRTAIDKVAGPAIRNYGTLGGNLASASGKADTAVVDLALDAVLHIRSAAGKRFLPATEFYRGFHDVDLRGDELITEILIPDTGYLDNAYFDKMSVRSAVAISNISIACVWNIEDSILRDIRIAIGATTDYPIRVTEIEARIRGKSLAEIRDIKDDYLEDYIEEMNMPLDRTVIFYRKQVLYNLLTDLIREEFFPLQL